MSEPRLPNFGDVITSKRFQFGYLNYDGKPPIQVGQGSPEHIVGRSLTDDEIVAEIKGTGSMPPKWKNFDYGVPDESRGTAEFVVIENDMQGGGTAMGYDVYPDDGWHIVAKRLDKDGQWDPDGEEIAFYMTGYFIDMIPPEEVTIVRHMAMHFV
ncbi:hypothetical protein D4S03_12370 [bacterium]|nr:MAG: hypothetical protein D4S03_12370 [bacterium]